MSTTKTRTKPTRTTKPKPAAVWRNAFGQTEVSLNHPDAHVSAPARNCACRQCAVHRAWYCKRLVEHNVARLYEIRYPSGGCGRVAVGANATDEMRDLMEGED